MGTPKGASLQPNTERELPSHGAISAVQTAEKSGVLPLARLGAGAVRLGFPLRVTGTLWVLTSSHCAAKGSPASANQTKRDEVIWAFLPARAYHQIPTSFHHVNPIADHTIRF